MDVCTDPSLTRYKGGECRCDACRALNVAYMRAYHRRRILVGAGDLVSAEAAREHLRWLKLRGVAYKRAAELAGLSQNHVWRIVTGKTQRLQRSTHNAILRVLGG